MRRLAAEVIGQLETKSAQREREEIMPSLMATSLRWRTHSGQTNVRLFHSSAYLSSLGFSPSLSLLNFIRRVVSSSLLSLTLYCQTPIPGETWSLTLVSRSKNKNNKNPPQRIYQGVVKLCHSSWDLVTRCLFSLPNYENDQKYEYFTLLKRKIFFDLGAISSNICLL